MPKTKTRTKTKIKKTIKETAPTTPLNCSTKCNTQVCWLGWLLKLMIGLFVALIIFWVGFCFGTVSSNLSAKYRALSSTKPCYLYNQAHQACLNAPAETLLANIISSLNNKVGDNFDQELILQITLHNQAAIEIAELALNKSSREEIKDLARTIIDKNNKEIDLMKNWGGEMVY